MENLIAGLEMAIEVIEGWVPMFEQHNAPAFIERAIELLKEQEKVKVVFVEQDGWCDCQCGNCGEYLDKTYSRCPKCGRELDWNG